MKRGPELARDGGLRGPEDPEPLKGSDTLVEGVGGRMEDEEGATDEADEGGLTGVLLLRKDRKSFDLSFIRHKIIFKKRENNKCPHTCCRWGEIVQTK